MTAPKSDIEAIRATIHALLDAGWSIHHVDDGEEEIATTDENEAIAALTAVDQSWLYVRRGLVLGYVLFVLGNDPEEVVCDYTTNLDPIVDELTRTWW
jgi:hypothetical protein